MEERRWITGAQVKELLGFVGVELVLISGGVLSPHDPFFRVPIPVDHICKIIDSWKYECSKGIAVRYNDDLLEDRLVGKYIKEGFQFWKNSRGRTPLGLLSEGDLRKAIREFDEYLYDYATIEKYREEIIATYQKSASPKDFVMMFKNKLTAHEGFSPKQTETLSIRLRKRFPETNFSDGDIAQLIVDVFQQCRCEQEQASTQSDEKPPKRSKKQVAQDIKAEREKRIEGLFQKANTWAQEEFISQGRRMIHKELYAFLNSISDESVSGKTEEAIWKRLPSKAKNGPGRRPGAE